ncbi:hypothetical protein S83_019625, partial [Arachis hypogaea]
MSFFQFSEKQQNFSRGRYSFSQQASLASPEKVLAYIKAFGEDFLHDKLKPFLKSDPNDGDVKIVVGDNFDDIVLDESKDVLLEVANILVDNKGCIKLADFGASKQVEL